MLGISSLTAQTSGLLAGIWRNALFKLPLQLVSDVPMTHLVLQCNSISDLNSIGCLEFVVISQWFSKKRVWLIEAAFLAMLSRLARLFSIEVN